MTAFVVFGVGLFWVFLLWRVKVERGNAHSIPRPFALLKLGVIRLRIDVGSSLLPALRKAIAAMKELAAAFDRAA